MPRQIAFIPVTSNTPSVTSYETYGEESQEVTSLSESNNLDEVDGLSNVDVFQTSAQVASPIVQRMSSFRAPADLTHATQDALALMLKADLGKHSANLTADTYRSDRIVRNCSIDQFMKAEGENFLKDGALPNLGKLYSETHLADYFNHIVALFFSYMTDKVPPRGYWTAEKGNKLLRVGSWGAKPDIMLVPVQNGFKVPLDLVMWPVVYAVAETTPTTHPTRRLSNTSASKAFLMMYTQGDRSHVPTLTMNGRDCSIHVFDRAGRVSINLDYKNPEHAEIFVHFLLSISYEKWGFDRTMTRREIPFEISSEEFPSRLTDGEKRFSLKYAKPATDAADSAFSSSTATVVEDAKPAPAIAPKPPASVTRGQKRKRVPSPENLLEITVLDPDSPSQATLTKSELEANLACGIDTIACGGARFKVEAELFRSPSLIGRGTRVWQATNTEGETVIIKESWILEQREYIEAELIKNVHGRQTQIPRVIKHQELKDLSIAHFYPTERRGSHREKRRLVMTPACVSVLQAQSPLEILGLFLDYTLAIRYLKERNLMHRDISSANLMISLSSDSIATWRKDPIIDVLKNSDAVLANDMMSALWFLQSRLCRRGVLIDYDYATFINKEIKDPLLPSCQNTSVDSGHSEHSTRPSTDSGGCKDQSEHGKRTSTILSHLQKDFAHFAPDLQELWLGLYPPQELDVSRPIEPVDCTDKFVQIFVKAILREEARLAASEQESTMARNE
ncbi:hypothetical protein C0992_009706 [Termitomyces sp. T32_za158]|nr:hypothetical protein C0992_009706 [Termitomyces sp. T32_za158]